MKIGENVAIWNRRNKYHIYPYSSSYFIPQHFIRRHGSKRGCYTVFTCFCHEQIINTGIGKHIKIGDINFLYFPLYTCRPRTTKSLKPAHRFYKLYNTGFHFRLAMSATKYADYFITLPENLLTLKPCILMR